MNARKSDVFLGSVAAGCGLLLYLWLDAAFRVREQLPMVRARQSLVRELGLTDLSLFTDSRYTRNPAVADVMTPFQDHPFALEHFPSGSLINPPPRRSYGLD